MISDIQDEYLKKIKYVQESSRFVPVGRDAVMWEGPSWSHFILRAGHSWRCDCSYARLSDRPCCHVMALEQLLCDDEFFLESATEGELAFLEWVPTVWMREPTESCRLADPARRR